jgi:hypothetical protein
MTERELERRAQRRLVALRYVEEVSGNVAATCRYYGISRQCYYGWLCRYEADGLEGLKDRSRPGHQLQVDVKFTEPLGQTGRRKKYYQFTAIDDCTRLRVLRAYPRCDQKTAIAFIDDVMAKLPFAVERVQTDNGAVFTGKQRDEGRVALEVQLGLRGIRPLHSRPYPTGSAGS